MPIEQDMIVIEKTVSQEDMPWGGRGHEEAPVSDERQRQWRENMGKNLHCGFHRKENTGQGKQA